MSYKKIIEHYKNLPEDKKQFIYGEYFSENQGQCCAIGALRPWLFSDLTPEENDNNFNALNANNPEIFKYLKQEFDITLEELCLLQDINDFGGAVFSETPKERFERVLNFLEEKENNPA